MSPRFRRASLLLLAVLVLQLAIPAAADDGATSAPEEDLGRVIVQFAADQAGAMELLTDHTRRGSSDVRRAHVDVLPHLDVAIVHHVTPDDIAALEADPRIESVVADVRLSTSLATVTERTGATRLHADGFTGAGSTIAILDTGVDRSHAALAGAIVGEACFSSTPTDSTLGSCPNGSIEQIGAGSAAPCQGDPAKCAHGTHVAATAAGRATSGSAAGTAPGADILAIQVFDSDGTSAWMSDLLKAMNWTRNWSGNTPVSAVNLSLGAPPSQCDQATANLSFRRAVTRLAEGGAVTVAAAGNDGWNTRSTATISFPACLSETMSVAALGSGDTLASYSNVTADVDLLAPGTVRAAVPGGGYRTAQGTSMATPQVAGAIALLREREPRLSAAAVRSALKESGHAVTTSVGALPRVDVDRARGRPGRPGNVAATRGDRRAIVSWSGASRQSASSIVRYRVTASPSGPSMTVNGSARSATMTGLSNGRHYTFTVRAENRVVSGSTRTSNVVVPKPTPPAHGFPDVRSNAYYDRAVRWLKAEDITTGYGTTGRYEPDLPVTRAQMAAFLHRTFDEPRVSTPHGFPDVSSSAYYDRAVRWLKAEGITTGYGTTGRYRPDRPVTRAEMAAFLWRAAGEPTGYARHGYPDVASSAYYDDAVRWLKAEGITTGYGTTGRYEPGRPVTRAQMAAFLHRLASTPSAWSARDQVPTTIVF